MEKKIFIISFLFALSIFFKSSLLALGPSCYPNWVGSYFLMPFHNNEPPLSTDMPLDVMIGYIALDSVAMNGRYSQLYKFMSSLTYNDTMKKMMRYWYKIVEWDPYRFESYSTYSLFKYPKVSVNEIIWQLMLKIKQESPQPFIELTLLSPSIIAHVKVVDTTFVYDSTAAICTHRYIATCEVLDTIKGRMLPRCSEYYPRGNNLVGSIGETNCLKFDYCLSWNKGRNREFNIADSSFYLFDEEGKPWIKKDMEYIVFLDVGIVCDDSLGIYYSFSPNGGSYYHCMYPIKNGFVQDYENEFGLGTSVPVEEFKAFLRQKIYEIKNY
ncbi:hypothetical protein D9V84_04140 [Bacteroidetes/Chlorobi group bacterium Naka2016]|jgi:hypothetical protein|nr:MAG: hypothetical protein D9V84_04140 [Bacteroidetes/Chlorobi group bacterium Naka2016]